jgi:surface antigen
MTRTKQYLVLAAVAMLMAFCLNACIKADKLTGPQMTVNQKGNTVTPYSSSRFLPQYCTWYAASEFDKVAPTPGCNWGGDAGTWIGNASSAGWKTFSYPAFPPTVVGSMGMPNGTIVVWTNSGAGHVAVLRSVAQNGIWIQEKNWPVGSGVSPWRYLTWSEVVTRGSTGSYHLSGFIPPWRK